MILTPSTDGIWDASSKRVASEWSATLPSTWCVFSPASPDFQAATLPSDLHYDPPRSRRQTSPTAALRQNNMPTSNLEASLPDDRPSAELTIEVRFSYKGSRAASITALADKTLAAERAQMERKYTSEVLLNDLLGLGASSVPQPGRAEMIWENALYQCSWGTYVGSVSWISLHMRG